jgi:hypothetical protein
MVQLIPSWVKEKVPGTFHFFRRAELSATTGAPRVFSVLKNDAVAFITPAVAKRPTVLV